jgi:hypothetical protein
MFDGYFKQPDKTEWGGPGRFFSRPNAAFSACGRDEEAGCRGSRSQPVRPLSTQPACSAPAAPQRSSTTTGGSTPATSARSRPAAASRSSTARRTSSSSARCRGSGIFAFFRFSDALPAAAAAPGAPCAWTPTRIAPHAQCHPESDHPPPRLPPPPTPPPLPLPQGEYIAVEKLEATYMKASPVEQVGDPRGWSRGSCRGLRAGRGGGARRGWQRCGRKCAVQQRG